MDPGEALSGVTFLISGGSPHVTRSATTDAAGVLEFRGLPAGSYYTQVSWIGSGWFVPLWSGQVGGGHDPDVLLRAIPELGDRFAVSLAFTQPEYRSDDIPRALLTLRNTGTVLLTDLAADCGDADVGELTPNGPGVVLRPGETRVFTVTKAPTTNWEAQRGHLWMQCRVGAPLLHQDTTANAVTRIIAPWAPRVVGRLWAQTSVPPLGPPSGYPLPGVKIYLRDQIDGAIVARAVTNANGDFTFLNVRPGPYGVGVVGPWKGGYNSSMVVMAGENGSPSHDVYVVPGPNQPDPDPESSPLPPPPPAGGGGSTSPPPFTGKPVLAATGANVTWLAFGGLLSLIAGALLVLRARPARQ
jgi:LPXTG-motif cell wall-anchored protein